MNFKTNSLVLLFIIIPILAIGQIRFSENIQVSKTAHHKENALYFIDFWATWCGPCVYASEYLSVLQIQNPDRFYVISLSEENPDVVKRFLKKHPTDLAVSIDYNGETFKNNNIKILPYGLLVNADGTVLWQGSPTDFKQNDLNRYLNQRSKTRHVDDVFKIKKVKDIATQADYSPTSDFEIRQLKNESFETLMTNQVGHHRHYKGDLKSILARELKILKSQLNIAPELNKTYEIYVKKDVNLKWQMLEELDLELYHSEISGDALILDVSNIRYWDTQQIDWGIDTAEYLIDDTQIQGDNVTYEDIMYQLSSVLNLPVVTKGGDIDQLKHDWQIHHRFYNLLQTDLQDTYGITVEKDQGKFKTYTLIKKTPK